MPTYCLTVSYDGTDFAGWQRQANGPSVQATLEQALQQLLGHPVTCRAAGRTDAGVHASGQVVSFASERIFPCPERALVFATNRLLPPSIVVASAKVVSSEFDARFSASGKMYRYQIWNSPVRSPLYARTHWHVFSGHGHGRPLDLSAMQEAAPQFVGQHDFQAFRAAHCDCRTTVRRVDRLEVFRPFPNDAATLYIEVEATAFLRHMVRIIVGTLVEIGSGRRKIASIPDTLRSGERQKAGMTAPAHGLQLCRVNYGPRT